MHIRVIRWYALRRRLFATAVGIGCAALLIWPQGAATGVSRGLSVCGSVIIPSLFPFLVLTGVFVRSGLAARLGRRCGGVMEALFGLPGCCGAAVLIGAVGGYPAGAAAVQELLRSDEIDERQARQLLRFCVNGGPAFLIGTVGAGLLGSTYKGVLLYVAHLVASFLIGLSGRRRCCGTERRSAKLLRRPPMPQIIAESVSAACESMLTMCGFVVLFSSFLTLSEVSGLTRAVTGVLALPFPTSMPTAGLYAAFFEVSSGSVAVADCGTSGLRPLLLGATLGWGGVSVHCQLGGMLSQWRVLGRGYFLARFWHAILGGGLSALLFCLMPQPVTVTVMATSAVPVLPSASGSALASAAMLLMCGTALLAFSPNDKKGEG